MESRPSARPSPLGYRLDVLEIGSWGGMAGRVLLVLPQVHELEVKAKTPKLEHLGQHLTLPSLPYD